MFQDDLSKLIVLPSPVTVKPGHEGSETLPSNHLAGSSWGRQHAEVKNQPQPHPQPLHTYPCFSIGNSSGSDQGHLSICPAQGRCDRHSYRDWSPDEHGGVVSSALAGKISSSSGKRSVLPRQALPELPPGWGTKRRLGQRAVRW